MDELTLSTAAPERRTLDALPDDELCAMINQARAILEGRATARRREAIDAIKRLARENGLSVNVNTRTRKRGRPRKNSPASGQ